VFFYSDHQFNQEMPGYPGYTTGFTIGGAVFITAAIIFLIIALIIAFKGQF